MVQQANPLIQSRYYSPAFNAAIFDGSLKIYFAQYQEALALKLYFKLQESLGHRLRSTGADAPRPTNVFVMMYPTEEMYRDCFAPRSNGSRFERTSLGEDQILGIQGPLREEDYQEILASIQEVWAHSSPATPPMPGALAFATP